MSAEAGVCAEAAVQFDQFFGVGAGAAEEDGAARTLLGRNSEKGTDVAHRGSGNLAG